MTAISEFRNVLRDTVKMWETTGNKNAGMIERVVYTIGIDCISQSLPSKYKSGRPNACFMNTSMVVHRHKNLRYCEGFACRIGFSYPIHHAWAIDGENRVIDVTWTDPEKGVYIGVPFTYKEWDDYTGINSASIFDTGRGLNIQILERLLK